jgi:hypothetical protein
MMMQQEMQMRAPVRRGMDFVEEMNEECDAMEDSMPM